MTDAKPYKVTWRSAIDSDQTTTREEAFETEEAAKAFVNLTNKSKHRTVLRTIGFEVSAGPTLVPIKEFKWTDEMAKELDPVATAQVEAWEANFKQTEEGQRSSRKLIPINEFEWTDDYSFHRTLTCVNHPTARYSTKNPFFRRLICTKLPEGDDFERTKTGECTCPFSDLMVVVTGNGDAS